MDNNEDPVWTISYTFPVEATSGRKHRHATGRGSKFAEGGIWPMPLALPGRGSKLAEGGIWANACRPSGGRHGIRDLHYSTSKSSIIFGLLRVSMR